MHRDAFVFLAEEARALGRRRGILELGAPHAAALGLFDGPRVDAASDAPVDTVLCAELLQHVTAGETIVAAAIARLEIGGVLLVTCAAPGRPGDNGGGGHYAPINVPTLEAWVTTAGGAVCVRLEYWPDRGDLYARVYKAYDAGAVRAAGRAVGALSGLWSR